MPSRYGGILRQRRKAVRRNFCEQRKLTLAVFGTRYKPLNAYIYTHMIKRPFVLSGGGARGFAHIGVLKAFAEVGIYPEAISATSAGAMVGALIACGYTADEVHAMAADGRFFKLFSKTAFTNFRLSNAPMAEFLQHHLRYTNFEQLPVPFFVAATNLINGQQSIFNTGPIIPAVLAACAVPFVFDDVYINNIPHADGGMSSNLPVEPLLEHYTNIIGVYVNPLPDFNEKAGLGESIDRMMHLLLRENVLRSIAKCTLLIEPPNLKHYRMFEEKKKEQIITEGYNYTRSILQANAAK